MKRAVYYARVSTEEEHQASALIIQCRENEEFISKKNDWMLVDQYIDEGKTGTTIEGRNEFIRMIDDMADNKYDIILIKQIDRGWRNLGDWKIFESQLLKHNKKLFIRLRNEFYDIEDDSKYISTTMDNMFSEWHSRNLSKKMNNAQKTRMKTGRIITNGRLWGYDQKDADLVINEKEAEVVRYVFNSYIQGKGFRTINIELQNMGITSLNGTPFALTTLKRMIRNEKYKGVLVCGKNHKSFYTKKIEAVPPEDWIIHKDRIPPIVTEDIWNKANEILHGKRKLYSVDEKNKVAGYFNGSYPLSGKIICDVCKDKYYHGTYKNKNSPRISVWQCKRYKMHGIKSEWGCSNITVKCDELDEIIKEQLFDFWQNKEESLQTVMDILSNTLETDDNKPTIDKLKSEKVKLNDKRSKILDLYTEGIIDKENLSTKIEEINKEIKNNEVLLHNVMKTSDSILTIHQRMEKIKAFLESDITDKNCITPEMMEDLIDEVTIYPNREISVIINGEKYPNVSAVRPNGFTDRNPVGII